MVKVHYTNVKHTDYLAPIDYDNCAKAENPLDRRVEDIIELISNVTMYHRAVNELRIDTDLLPVSGLKKESIQKAKQVLNKLAPVVKELEELRKKHMNADFEEVARVKSVISKISSEFYSIIPKSEHKDDIIKPIQHPHFLAEVFKMIDQLCNIEFSSRLLLGALYRQYTFNPIQYIYESMGVRIQALSKGDPECDLVRAYAMNTCDASLNY